MIIEDILKGCSVCVKGGKAMENPELEFLLYLLNRYVKNNDIDPAKLTVAELMENINVNLTPVGGG